MEKPLVSIALCTYNGEKYLEEQLESILFQTYTNLEIIVVDDGSADNTKSIIKDLEIRDSRIRSYENDTNLGFNKNFEKAISLCNGDFIALSDQDDVWVPTKIAELVSAIGDKWVIFSNSTILREDNTEAGNLLENFAFDRMNHRGFLLNNFVSGHTMLFRKQIRSALFPIPGFGYYDWYLGFLAMYHNQLCYYDKVLTNYRVHSQSVVQQRELKVQSEKNRGFENFVLIKTQLKAFLSYKENKPTDRIFIENLLDSFSVKATKFSFALFKLVLFNYNQLFPLKKRNSISIFNFAFKFARRIRSSGS